MYHKLPLVSVIIPCRNEEKYIIRVLEQIRNQDYEGPVEIIVVDALSIDNTKNLVERFIQKYSNTDIKLLSNKKIYIPSGLNLGIRAAKGEIIIRMDGHSIPYSDYIKNGVQTILHKNYEVVGGICKTKPGSDNRIARLIAVALSHPFGVGDSHFRLLNKNVKPKFVDTVPFGCFKKSLWQTLRGYNENLIVNEDYDFNYRVRENGGKVYLNPKMISEYYTRDSLIGLIRQFYRYGKWKFKMLKYNPKSLRWRHVVPPIFVFSFFIFGIGGIFSSLLFYLWILEISIYILSSFVVTIYTVKNKNFLIEIITLPVIFLSMHFSWGLGVINSALSSLILKS
jgi:cellulose synthase/poly-beta-1,6-N-acetylglucosamine synthase-like glycosyltransferase